MPPRRTAIETTTGPVRKHRACLFLRAWVFRMPANARAGCRRMRAAIEQVRSSAQLRCFGAVVSANDAFR